MPALFESIPREFISNTVFYDYKTPITETMDSVKRLGAVVITKDDDYYGIVDDRSIFRTRGLKSMSLTKEFSVGKFAVKAPLLNSNTSLGSAINYFHEFSAKALPYHDGSRIKGVVRREVVLSAILSLHLLSKADVGDAMSTPLLMIDSKSNVAQANTMMEKNKVSRLAVMDSGRLAGLLSQRDISDVFVRPKERLPEKKAYSFSPSTIQVSSIMKSPVHTIDYGKPLENAIKEMLERRVSSLVVMRSQKAVGMVSIRDIIESAAAAMAKAESKVMISGLDEYTKEFENDIKDSVNKLVDRIDRFEKLNVDYVAVNIRRFRERNYEVKGRLALQKRGTIFAHATGYSLESALSDLLGSIYKRVKEKKETIVGARKGADRYYGE